MRERLIHEAMHLWLRKRNLLLYSPVHRDDLEKQLVKVLADMTPAEQYEYSTRARSVIGDTLSPRDAAIQVLTEYVKRYIGLHAERVPIIEAIKTLEQEA